MRSLRDWADMIENMFLSEEGAFSSDIEDDVPSVILEEAAPYRGDPEPLPQYLYHGTSIDNLVRIVGANFLAAGSTGVSLTRSLETAFDFAAQQEEMFSEHLRDYGMDSWKNIQMQGGVIVLDTSKLEADYRLSDRGHYEGSNDGEVTTDEEIKSLMSYVVAIVVKPSDIDTLEEVIADLLADENEDAMTDYNQRWKTSLELLKNSPVLADHFSPPA
jgi:hypothetical protein